MFKLDFFAKMNPVKGERFSEEHCTVSTVAETDSTRKHNKQRENLEIDILRQKEEEIERHNDKETVTNILIDRVIKRF